MSLERMPGPPGGEPAPPAGAGESGTPAALRLQVLSTEHWSLLATRNLAWTETFARAGMFLSALSGAIVALALVAQATSFGNEFAVFALVILPVVLFIGVTTVIRIGRSNAYDAICVVGMNRIRHAYLEIAPEVRPYLVMGTTDDEAAVAQTMGMSPGRNMVADILVATPFMVTTINAVIAGAIAAIATLQIGGGILLAGAAAVVAAAITLLGQLAIARRRIAALITTLAPKFPAPAQEENP